MTSHPGAGAFPLGVNVRWQAPDGQLRTGVLLVPFGATAGSTVPVWVDHAGQLADPPLGCAQLVTPAQLVEGLAVAALVIALIAASWLARWALDRRRMAAWDADWLATGPRWTPRR